MGFAEQARITELERRLRELETAQTYVNHVRLEILHVEPKRPRDGMIVYADGFDWNPGSGEGFYGRQAGAWVKL